MPGAFHYQIKASESLCAGDGVGAGKVCALSVGGEKMLDLQSSDLSGEEVRE